MQNPWIHLPETGERILPEDLAELEKVYQRRVLKHDFRLELYPEPFLGSPESAEIIVLCLNPGFGETDVEEHEGRYFARQSQDNLLHRSVYPFYLLDPKLERTGGYKWWSRHLRSIIEAVGRERVAEKVMAIEWFPYHSVRFRPLPRKHILPSQRYSFSLVREAITQKKEIVIMRSKRLWCEAVPELARDEYIELSNPQNPCLSSKQMKPEQYDRLLERLRR